MKNNGISLNWTFVLLDPTEIKYVHCIYYKDMLMKCVCVCLGAGAHIQIHRNTIDSEQLKKVPQISNGMTKCARMKTAICSGE